MCDCETEFPNVAEKSGYDEYYDYTNETMYDTKKFTDNSGLYEVMCPKHHGFFQFLCGKLNLEMPGCTECIIHSWCFKPTNTLKILWYMDDYDDEKEKLLFGLRKAWKMYSKNRFAQVYTYSSYCNNIVMDEYDSDDDYN